MKKTPSLPTVALVLTMQLASSLSTLAQLAQDSLETRKNELFVASSALLDSLTNYHFLKIRHAEIQRQNHTLYSDLLQTQMSLARSKAGENLLVLKSLEIQKASLRYRSKYRRASLERWLWRTAAVAGTYFFFKAKIPEWR